MYVTIKTVMLLDMWHKGRALSLVFALLVISTQQGCGICRKRKRITKRRSNDDSESEFSLSDEAAANEHSDQAPSDSASFETDSELSDDPLGEYDDADEDMYEQRRHKYARGDYIP